MIVEPDVYEAEMQRLKLQTAANSRTKLSSLKHLANANVARSLTY